MWNTKASKRHRQHSGIPSLFPYLPASCPPTLLRVYGATEHVTTCLTDRANYCAAQTAAAINNIALLSYSVSSIAETEDALPTELAHEIGRQMAAILTLFTAAAVAQSLIMAWMTMLQCNMWLQIFQLPKRIRKLEGPFSSVGVFGPLLQEATTNF
ncbi:hypothetical protein Q8A73_006392 [Channa argus]|nr:hypothetical protein Q8A73_006392 [Channa argus]